MTRNDATLIKSVWTERSEAAAKHVSNRPIKHSLTLKGHRTSVSLEPEFWDAFRNIAAAKGIPINQLAAQVDESRDFDVGLASAIRVFILNEVQSPSGEKSK